MTQAEDISVESELGFNPFDPAFRENPYPTYRRLRETAPVQRSPLGMFVLSRYADCANILRSPHVSNDARKAPNFREQVIAQGFDPDTVMLETRPFLFLDPPDHTRLRGLVNKAFTPRVVEALRPRIEQVVQQQIDAVARKGAFEVIEDLAYPLPVIIISEMLGVPAEDADKFKRWSRELVRGLDPEFALPPEELERRQATLEAFRAFFEDLIAKRRAEPRDDLISALIAAEDQGNQLTEEELLSTCVLLLVAGHETTVNLIGNGVLALLRNPDQLSSCATTHR
ncbi:MAG TPA: cytochrome P450 [Dehalococcoidia bacterium]|nr:cytochrome P450 [Dehalococcoidia bacterium]